LLAKPIVLRMTCSSVAEPNRSNSRVWNGHGNGYATTLPVGDWQMDRRHYCDH